jgi:hypothetical protein
LVLLLVLLFLLFLEVNVVRLGKPIASILLCCIALIVFLPLAMTGVAQPAMAADAVVAAATVAPVESASVIGQWLKAVPEWLQLASLVVTTASSIAVLTPSPKDDNFLSKARTLLDILALNFGGAKRVKRE